MPPEAPRHVSAGRASLHFLSRAANPRGPTLKPLELWRAVAGENTSRGCTEALWSTLAALIHTRMLDWRGKLLLDKTKKDSYAHLSCIPGKDTCRAQLLLLGYKRSAFYGWHSDEKGESKEVALAIGWLAGAFDAFGVAREMAWRAREPASPPPPPWPSDVGDDVVFGGHPGSPIVFYPGTISDSGKALLYRYGRLQNAIRELHSLEVSRALQLGTIDIQQQPDSQIREKRTPCIPGSKAASAYEVHVLSSTSRKRAACAALSKSIELSERLRVSCELESDFWTWISAAAEVGAGQLLVDQSEDHEVREAAEAQRALYAELLGRRAAEAFLAALWKQVDGTNRDMEARLAGARRGVDEDLAPFAAHLSPHEFPLEEGVPGPAQADVGALDRQDIHEAIAAARRSDERCRSVLAGALRLCVSHLPQGVETAVLAASKPKSQMSAGGGASSP